MNPLNYGEDMIISLKIVAVFIRKMLTSLWTLVILGLLGFYVLLYFFLDLPTNIEDFASVNPMRTLLGGLATGLITAQALVFTISLVAAQLNARYTHRMISRIFTWPTGLYMGLFSFSSIYSLVVLAALSSRSNNFAFYPPGGLHPVHPVLLALDLAGTCLVLLVPYLWSFKRRLDPELMSREGARRAIDGLRNGASDGANPVAALDNIIMSAFGYRDYDTFDRGLSDLADVGLEAWRRSLGVTGHSIFRRMAQIGVATIDDPRAPFQVTSRLGTAGSALSDEGLSEAARQVAIAMSEIAEVAIEKNQVAVTRHILLILSEWGQQAGERGVIPVAEEASYLLGHLGTLAARRGMEDSARQAAIYLRGIGTRTSLHRIDLATRQSLVSLWCLGGTTYQHLTTCSKFVASELQVMEQLFNADLVDSSYLLAPQSEALVNFRDYYLVTVRRSSSNMTEVVSDYRPAVGNSGGDLTPGRNGQFEGSMAGRHAHPTG
jgi:hypothetical protein